ncbi:MAG: hypothetical protein Q8J74_14715 [Candidatus Didemnitutus sp.]|nr:hypothetical protein [Candidatus Didemnitutus sp.]
MPETQIREALQQFDTAVKSADGGGISTALAQLETLLTTHRGELHPQLVHFLEGRSYAKALLYLGGRSEFLKPSSPPGGCGNH